MHSFVRLALLLFCGPLFAQQIWVVDPNGGGDFTDLQTAIAAVTAGDTLLVRAGTYSGAATIDKPLQVIGDDAGTVRLDNLRVGPLTVPGRVVVARLTVLGSLPIDAPTSMDGVVFAAGGVVNHPVVMRECRFGPNFYGMPGLQVASGDVVIQNCVGRGAPSTVWVTRGCNVSASSPALSVTGGTVTVANSSIAGINLGPVYCPHYPAYGFPSAAAAVTGGLMVVTNSTLTGGMSLNNRIDAVTGPFAGDASTLTNPQSTTMTPIFLPATRALSAAPGGAIDCRIMTRPVVPAILVASLGTRSPVSTPFGSAWVDPGAYTILRWGVADSSGRMDATIQLPHWVPPGLPFTIQGLAIEPGTSDLVLSSPAVAHVL